MTIRELRDMLSAHVRARKGDGPVMVRTKEGHLLPATPEVFVLDESGVTNVNPILVVNSNVRLK